MWRRLLSLFVALALFSSLCWALPQPSWQSLVPAGWVILSPEEADLQEQGMLQAREALVQSSEKIAAQSKALTGLSLLCATLAAALLLQGAADLITSFK